MMILAGHITVFSDDCCGCNWGAYYSEQTHYASVYPGGFGKAGFTDADFQSMNKGECQHPTDEANSGITVWTQYEESYDETTEDQMNPLGADPWAVSEWQVHTYVEAPFAITATMKS